MTLTSRTVRRAIRRFSDLGQDLLAADHNTFMDRITAFVHFCENDPVFSRIDRQLSDVAGVEFDSWYRERRATMGGMVGSGRLQFPPELDKRLALQYRLAKAMADESITVEELGFTFFATGSTRYDDRIFAVSDGVLQPLVRDLIYELEEVEHRLPEDESAPVLPAAIQIIHNTGTLIQQTASGTSNVQSVSVDSGSAVFTQIRGAIEESIPAEARDELLGRLAALEASQGQPSFTEHYRTFIAAAANHISIVAPFIPALTELLP